MVAVMLLALALASETAPSQPGCLAIELSTTARSAHGSAIMLESAPHQLIRALDTLVAWAARSEPPRSLQIATLEAARTINIIPRRAVAVVEISGRENLAPGALLETLAAQLGPRVELRPLESACRSPR